MALDITIDEFLEDFKYLEEWEERYQEIIDLGRKLPPLKESYKTEQYKEAILKPATSGLLSGEKLGTMN